MMSLRSAILALAVTLGALIALYDAVAQAGKPTPDAQSVSKQTQSALPALPEAARLKVLVAYQHALLAQAQAAAAQTAFNTAREAAFATCAREARDAGAPEGTTCNVDVDAQTVTFVAPPAKSEKK